MTGKSMAILLAVLMVAETMACTLPLTPIPTQTSIPQPTPTPTPDLVSITVYFTDRALYVAGTPPFEVAVTRWVSPSSSLPVAVLQAFFAGPTVEERQQGLEAITSGFDGASALVMEEGVARVYLTGACVSLGATYTVAQPIMRNLLQFQDVLFVKIYDENGDTEDPDGMTNSIPFCLEP